MVTSHGETAKGYSPTSEFLPKEVQEILISTGNELSEHPDRFVKLLRWLSNADGQADVREEKDSRFGLYWKTTQEEYHHVPMPKQGPFDLEMQAGLQWTDQTRTPALTRGYRHC